MSAYISPKTSSLLYFTSNLGMLSVLARLNYAYTYTFHSVTKECLQFLGMMQIYYK